MSSLFAVTGDGNKKPIQIFSSRLRLLIASNPFRPHTLSFIPLVSNYKTRKCQNRIKSSAISSRLIKYALAQINKESDVNIAPDCPFFTKLIQKDGSSPTVTSSFNTLLYLGYHISSKIQQKYHFNMKLIDVIIFELKPILEANYFERILLLVEYGESIMMNALKNTAISSYVHPKYDIMNPKFEDTFKQISHLFKPKEIDNESSKAVDKCSAFNIMIHSIHNNLYYEFYYLFPLDVVKCIMKFYGSSSFYNNMQLQRSYTQHETIADWRHYLHICSTDSLDLHFILDTSFCYDIDLHSAM